MVEQGPNQKGTGMSSSRTVVARMTMVLTATALVLLGGCNSAPHKPPALPVFYPPLPQRPRIQFLRTLNSAGDIEPEPSALQRFIVGEVKEDAAARWIRRPYGVTFRNGMLYVCDTGGQKAAVFDFKQRKFHAFGLKGPQHLESPINISIAPDGTRYVTDTKAGNVMVFDGDGRFVRAIGLSEGMKPCDVIWRKGQLFVSDLKSSTILVFDPRSGQLLRRIGRRGGKPGQFGWPTNIAFGPGGRLYVCDTLNARVQVFDDKDKLVGMIGSRGTALGKMVCPKGIAVDRDSRLYVADAATSSVQIFDPDGSLLLMLGRASLDGGNMDMPSKVYVNYEGVKYFAEYASPDFRIEYLIFVTNQQGPNKINVYGFGRYSCTVSNEFPARKPTSAPAS